MIVVVDPRLGISIASLIKLRRADWVIGDSPIDREVLVRIVDNGQGHRDRMEPLSVKGKLGFQSQPCVRGQSSQIDEN